MSYAKNDLRTAVYSLFNSGDGNAPKLSCKEVAKAVAKEPKDINQVLKKLCDLGLLTRVKEKQDVSSKVFLYHLPNEVVRTTEAIGEWDEAEILGEEDEVEEPKKTCNNCQRYSGLEKCILLLLVKETAAWVLQGDLKARVAATSLYNVLGCVYFDPRQKGQCKRRTMEVFLRENGDGRTYEIRCPINRCNKVIDELSFSMQKKNIGSNALYCPHCGSAIIFTYNHGVDRYEVQYLDCGFDILQRDYEQLTGMKIPSRYDPERSHGFSIVKEQSFHIEGKLEAIYLGNDLTPTNFRDSTDLACFSLRQLNYIAVKYEHDYLYLKEKLHEIDPEKGRVLYPNIRLLFSGEPIESVEPTLREIGGNEMLIATGVPFHQMFYSDALDRRAVLAKKTAEMVDGEFRKDFQKALKLFDRDIERYSTPWNISYLEWKQKEGGFASLMLEPFRKEAEKYGFENISRKKARMVRWEPFMKYGLFTARTPKACFENGVNKLVDNFIKEKIYNDIDVPWDGLRGWCHRKYSNGLFLDKIERSRAITPLWINEAIRNEEIKPTDFETDRGKRYEKYYLMDKESHAYDVTKRVANQIVQTKLMLTTGFDGTNRRVTDKSVSQLKCLLNQLSNSSVELISKDENSGKIKTVWKKLQEEQDRSHLTRKEFQALYKFVRAFFQEEFSFKPYTIAEIL